MRAQILEDGQSSESNPDEERPTPQLAARTVLVQRARILAVMMGLLCAAFLWGRVSVSSEVSNLSSMPLAEQNLKVIGSDPPIINAVTHQRLESSTLICIDSDYDLCLNRVGFSEDVDLQPRSDATRWQTDFAGKSGSGIWLKSGKSGVSLGPSSTPVGETIAIVANSNPAGFGTDWGFDGDTIKLKGARRRAAGKTGSRRRRAGKTQYCLGPRGMYQGAFASWNPCNEDSWTFSS